MKYKSSTFRCTFQNAMPMRGVPSILVLIGSLGLALASGCSSFVESDRVQCSTNGDCARRGGAFSSSLCVAHLCQTPGSWSCLGNVVWPAPTAGTVTATLNLTEIITAKPVAGVSARVCRKLDVSCAEPLSADIVSDVNGRLVMAVSQGFDGYIELTATGFMPGIYFFYPPLTADREVPSVPLLAASSLSTLAGLAGTAVMADRGHVMIRAYTCLGQTAEGVRFSSAEGDSATKAFYMVKGIPSTTQVESDSSGQGGLLNLRPGTATLAGQLATGVSIGTLSVFTRAGQVTYTAMVPAPQ